MVRGRLCLNVVIEDDEIAFAVERDGNYYDKAEFHVSEVELALDYATKITTLFLTDLIRVSKHG